MTDQMYSVLKRSYTGDEIIKCICELECENQILRTEAEMQTLARKTAVEELRIVLNENKRLKQLVDADSKYVCARKP